MTEDRFDLIKQIKGDIDSKRQELQKIRALFTCCGLKLNVSGTRAGQMRTKIEYDFYSTADICILLNKRANDLDIQIEKLEKEFAEL